MSLVQTAEAFAVGRDEGEALWLNGALFRIKATAEHTAGRYSAIECVARKDFAAPLHVHQAEDEFWVVLEGEVRFQFGESIIEAGARSLVYGPRTVAHSFRVDSEEARLLLLVGPGGVDGFFREAGNPARYHGFPPPDEQYADPMLQAEISARYGNEFVGPPLGPKS